MILTRLKLPALTLLPALALLSTLAPLLAAAPLRAQTVDDIVKAQILPGSVDAAGNRVAAIKLTLLPGWKTYWRAPGEAGIPPIFDWSGSRNLADVALLWPRPEVFELNGLTSIGYYDELVLPVALTPQRPAAPLDLRLRIEIGVCKDICVPAVLTLRATLADRIAAVAEVADPAIARALATRPVSAAKAGVQRVTCAVTPIADGLSIRATITVPTQGGAELVVFETADPQIWVSPAATSRAGATLTATADLVPPAGVPFALDRSSVTLTVLGTDNTVEIHGCPAP